MPLQWRERLEFLDFGDYRPLFSGFRRGDDVSTLGEQGHANQPDQHGNFDQRPPHRSECGL